MGGPTGEADRGAPRRHFDSRLLLQFRGSAMTSDAGLLTYRELDDTLRLAFLWKDSVTTEKNWQLWPDVPADRALYDALETSDYAKWHAYKTKESGQHEVLNWFCFLGAMEAPGRKPDKAVFLENWAFVSPVVFAHYHA